MKQVKKSAVATALGAVVIGSLAMMECNRVAVFQTATRLQGRQDCDSTAIESSLSR